MPPTLPTYQGHGPGPEETDSSARFAAAQLPQGAVRILYMLQVDGCTGWLITTSSLSVLGGRGESAAGLLI